MMDAATGAYFMVMLFCLIAVVFLAGIRVFDYFAKLANP